MTAENTFVASYACPRCQAELDAPSDFGGIWLVCPRCGRAGLPPDALRIPARPRPIVNADVVYIGPADEESLAPLTPFRPARQALNPWRIFLLLGLIFCLFGLAEAFLSQNTARSAIFGFMLLVVVGLMTYPTRNNRP